MAPDELKAWRPCPSCGGEGVVDGDCDCGDDTCCCLEPSPPVCGHCGGAGGWRIPWSQADAEDGDIV